MWIVELAQFRGPPSRDRIAMLFYLLKCHKTNPLHFKP